MTFSSCIKRSITLALNLIHVCQTSKALHLLCFHWIICVHGVESSIESIVEQSEIQINSLVHYHYFTMSLWHVDCRLQIIWTCAQFRHIWAAAVCIDWPQLFLRPLWHCQWTVWLRTLQSIAFPRGLLYKAQVELFIVPFLSKEGRTYKPTMIIPFFSPKTKITLPDW